MKTNPKGYMLYDSIYAEFWKRQNYMDGKQISGCQGVVGGDGIDYKEVTKGNFQGVRNVLYGTVMVDT